jgi:hypothetical protein
MLQGDHEPMIAENSQRPTTRPRSFSESLYVFTSPSMLVGAMSPTRVGKVSILCYIIISFTKLELFP